MLPSIRMLRAARVLLNWSQLKLAEASGVHPSIISRLEGKKGGSAHAATLERLAAAMESAGVVFFSDSGMEGIKILVASPKDSGDPPKDAKVSTES